MRPLHTVWVDLMPLLPGGSNGGAKPFVLKLLQGLANQQPQTEFIATCRSNSLSNLQPLASKNLRLTIKKRWSSDRPHGAQLLFCPFGAANLSPEGLPIVSVFYDLQCLNYPMFFNRATRKQRQRNFHQQRRQSKHIAAISEYAKQEAIHHGMRMEQIIAIPIRLSDDQQAQHAITTVQAHCNPYILYPANLWPHKNHELLLTAWAMARQQGLPKDLKLICTGEGAARREWLEKITRELQLQDCVVFKGFVSDQALNALYKQTKGVIFPSLYEGFGMPIVEAMQRGIPLACSNNTACKEVSGNAALQFDPRCPQQLAEALIELSTNQTRREDLRQRGLKRSEYYQGLDVMVNEYWKLFQEALR